MSGSSHLAPFPPVLKMQVFPFLTKHSVGIGKHFQDEMEILQNMLRFPQRTLQ